MSSETYDYAGMDTESNDFPNNTSTSGVVEVGVIDFGVISFIGDIDWFKVSLIAGQPYRFSIEAGTINGLFDPHLAVYDHAGQLLVQATVGEGFQSKYVDFIPETTTDYFLSASGDSITGTYKITASLTSANGILSGTAANDTLEGTTGNDAIYGLSGNDTLTGGSGNDTLDGGSGIDIACYSGNRSSFSIVKTASGYTVTDHSGTDGTDTLTNVEQLWFSDTHVNLQIGDTAQTLSTADLHSLEELYVAFFNRVPDADGLSYWIGQHNGGLSMNTIAESFYSAGVQYSSLTGFSSTMSNTDFINVIYRNVLGRTEGADADGLAYWSDALASGAESRGSLVSTILHAAHTYAGDATWGWVADLLDNKITVADYFAVQQGLTYNTPSDSITHGMTIAAAVTATDTTAAIALIGVNDSGFNLLA